MSHSNVAKVNLRNQLRIQREYATSAEFMEQSGKRISAQGMFLAMRAPLEIGVIVELAFTLPSGRDILRGKTEVIKIQEENAKTPAGVWVKFLDITPRSQKNLDLIAAWRSQNDA